MWFSGQVGNGLFLDVLDVFGLWILGVSGDGRRLFTCLLHHFVGGVVIGVVAEIF